MGYVAEFGELQGILLSYSAQNEFAPHEMDYRSAIEFLSDLATGARRGTSTTDTA